MILTYSRSCFFYVPAVRAVYAVQRRARLGGNFPLGMHAVPSTGEEAVEELPSAIALAAEYSLYCAGEPHPMEVESHGEARCSCDRCSRWDSFVRGKDPGGWPRYEVITAELVAGLAAWLRGEPRRRQ